MDSPVYEQFETCAIEGVQVVAQTRKLRSDRSHRREEWREHPICTVETDPHQEPTPGFKIRRTSKAHEPRSTI